MNVNQFQLNISHFHEDNFPEEGIHVIESDYGVANIKLGETHGYEVEEIPMYGGEPIKHHVNTAEEVVSMIHSWT